MWVAVTNAGGAVGFYPPVTEAQVRPLAEAAFDRVRDGVDELVVACLGEEPAGFGFLVTNANPYTSHWATIARLQRHPAHRGAGVGAGVLAELERLAGERGLDFVVLTVRAGTGLDRFYESHGYRTVATHPGWLKFRGDIVLDELVLMKPLGGGGDAGEDPGGEAGGDAAAAEPTLRVHRLDRDLPLPGYAHPGDAGLDLRTREDVTLAPGQRAVVPTGVAVAIPPGLVGLVHPRSGLAARHGLALVNAPGTIDAGYRGEIKVVLVNLDPTEPITLTRGDRIAQLLLQPITTVHVEDVPDLDPTGRGTGGFGSTGRS